MKGTGYSNTGWWENIEKVCGNSGTSQKVVGEKYRKKISASLYRVLNDRDVWILVDCTWEPKAFDFFLDVPQVDQPEFSIKH
jgi:hypothetical protein